MSEQVNPPIFLILYTVKPVLSCNSEIDKTKVLKQCGSLMQVKSIVEFSTAGQKYCRMLHCGAFCNTFDLHLVIIGLETLFLVFF